MEINGGGGYGSGIENAMVSFVEETRINGIKINDE